MFHNISNIGALKLKRGITFEACDIGSEKSAITVNFKKTVVNGKR